MLIPVRYGMEKGIVLIGFMGAGKSAIGRALARRLNVKHVDTDRLVEEKAGCSIADIFAHQGEEAFRNLEGELLHALRAQAPAIVSTGGGLPMREANWPALRALGTVVYLRAHPDTLFERVSRHRHRPLLRTANPRETFDALLARRTPVYERADLIVDTDGCRPGEAAEKVLRTLDARVPNERGGCP